MAAIRPPSRTVELVMAGRFYKSLGPEQQRRAMKALHEAAEAAQSPAADDDEQPGGRKGKAAGPSRLAGVLWLNLDRRPDRAQEHEASLARAGLERLAERVPAVDGRETDLRSVSEELLTANGRHQALNSPNFVLGRVLTPGAVGLWLTWHRVLMRIAREAEPDECFLVCEDDAEYGDNFIPRLQESFKALDAFDSRWHAVAVGFIRSKTRIKPLLGDAPVEGMEGTLDTVIGRIGKLTGAAALAVRGSEGARALLAALFPVDLDSQLDLKLSNVVDYYGKQLRLYCTAEPLAAAPLSEAGDSDIQRIPEERAAKFKLEARIRHELGDKANSAATAVEQLVHSGRLAEIAAEPGMPRFGPEELEKLVVEVYKSIEHMRSPNRMIVQWSLSEPFMLAGSWTEWQEPFTEMFRVADHPSAHRAYIENVRPESVEEFQILVGGDWKRRFFPMDKDRADAQILGPLDRHGYNFSCHVPGGRSKTMVITWDPTGMRSLDISFEASR